MYFLLAPNMRVRRHQPHVPIHTKSKHLFSLRQVQLNGKVVKRKQTANGQATRADNRTLSGAAVAFVVIRAPVRQRIQRNQLLRLHVIVISLSLMKCQNGVLRGRDNTHSHTCPESIVQWPQTYTQPNVCWVQINKNFEKEISTCHLSTIISKPMLASNKTVMILKL